MTGGGPPSRRPPWPSGPFLVVGLGRSGAAAALALRERGERVIGVDAGAPPDAGLAVAGVEVHAQTDGAEFVPHVRAVVKSPGVRADAPAIVAARRRGLVVLGELELAWRALENDFIAVTGTNGKTTTVELIGQIHREAGVPHAVAGNVGRALSSLIGAVSTAATIVCEASSFQLEDTLAFAPEAAVLLNVAEDHLDRHGTLDAYVRAKLEAFRRQGNEAVAVVAQDVGIEDLGGCARRVVFGTGPEAALADRAGALWWGEEPLISVEEIRLRGAHNRLNAMAAAAVALARGIEPDAVRATLRTFAGVAHRLEDVVERDGVLYVNDSKATNVACALVALRSFAPGSVHAIIGGQGKGQAFATLRDEVERRCAASYLIGEAAAEIADALAGLPVHICGELDRAVGAAAAAAHAGQVILLSPACASFDQFRDYEERGEAFRELVRRGP